MLKIFNILEPFFEDNYAELSVREFSRSINVSPPTASKILEEYCDKGILKKREYRRYKLYSAKRDNWLFLAMMKIYWENKLRESGLINHLESTFIQPVVILFGSSVKGELKRDSDIDLAVFTPVKKEFNMDVFERKIKRKIHIFIFKNKEEIHNKNLLFNILSGHVILGDIYEILE